MMLLTTPSVLYPKKANPYSSTENHLTNSVTIKRVPSRSNLDLESGWQTSIYHPSDKHQEQTVQKHSVYSYFVEKMEVKYQTDPTVV